MILFFFSKKKKKSFLSAEVRKMESKLLWQSIFSFTILSDESQNIHYGEYVTSQQLSYGAEKGSELFLIWRVKNISAIQGIQCSSIHQSAFKDLSSWLADWSDRVQQAQLEKPLNHVILTRQTISVRAAKANIFQAWLALGHFPSTPAPNHLFTDPWCRESCNITCT